jgi:alpha-1,4-digalacturonate transport system substrate-binding protein
MRLRVKIGAAGLAVAAMALTACAPGSSSSSSDSASGPKTVDFKSFKGKTLTYVYFTDGPDEQATRDAIAKFEAETGAKVNLQILPFADINTSLQARLSAGNAPEAARVADWHPFTDEAVDFKQYFGKDYPSQFTPGAASTVQDASGHMYAVPSDITINGPMINVDAFKKAGVAVPTKWTWD